MKNYEEMAQSVLKRRDTEIKRRRRAFLIGAPCAAAALVGVVGIGAAVASQSRGDQLSALINYYNDTLGAGSPLSTLPEYSTAASVIAEIATEVATVSPDPYEGNDIKVLDIDKFPIAERVDRSSMTFFEYDLEELGFYYGLDLNRLGDLHPNWKMSHDKLGLYNVKFEVIGGDLRITLCGVEEYDVNTLNYTTDSGALITVSAKQGKFESVSKEVFTHDKPTDPSKFTSETTYDENGNPDGTMVYPIDPNDWRPETDEGVSTVNGYEALIYRDADGNFLADIDIASRVRITAEGLSEKEFIEVLDSFTERTDSDIAIDVPAENEPPVNIYANPNVGDTKKVITYIDHSEPQDKPNDLDENDFTPYSLEQLDSFYSLRFNCLGELYPSWTLSYGKLGMYRHEENDGFVASLKLVGTLNTLDYTTENGGKVSVSAQYEEFAMPMIGDHIATFKKNITPVYPEVKYEYDEDGNIIGASTSAYDPTSNTSAPYVEGETNPDTGDAAWSKINGYDALIVAVLNDENKVDHYTAYIKMASYVRITAYNTDQFMFEEILDNFTK